MSGNGPAGCADRLRSATRNVGSIDASWVDEVDEHVAPIGSKGIGEIGITGASAAIANAVFHATGRRIRDWPIAPDQPI